MKWFLKENYILGAFQGLIALGILILFDYLIFSMLINFYETYIILLILALFSGIGALSSMNSIVHIIWEIKKNLIVGNPQYKNFIQLLLILISGTLITIPGLITSLLGWTIYIKPIRLLCTQLLFKYKADSFTQWYSLLLAEYMHQSHKS